jgi:hypothetical protein
MTRQFAAVAEELIARIGGRVGQRLEALTLVAPAYAVVIAPVDDLDPFMVYVGLVPDRARAIATHPPPFAFGYV